MPRTTLTTAQSTTGQRAISSTMPRQDKRHAAGWNQARHHHHISVDVAAAAR